MDNNNTMNSNKTDSKRPAGVSIKRRNFVSLEILYRNKFKSVIKTFRNRLIDLQKFWEQSTLYQ